MEAERLEGDCKDSAGIAPLRSKYVCMELDGQELEAQVRYSMRACWHAIQDLERMGMDRDDIEQEIRIVLWRASCAYDPEKSERIGFQTWLTYKVNFRLKSLKRNLQRKEHVGKEE